MQPGSLCPVFRPSLEEFSNFASYVETIEEDLKRWGICKVIPPVGWVCGLPYDPATAATTAPLPKTTFPTVRVIKQAPCGKGGVFQLAITDRAKPMGAEEYRARAMARQVDLTGMEFAEVEKRFWHSLTALTEAPEYGSDIVGSLFGAVPASGWNLNRLDSFLADLVGPSMPGITQSMLYYGSWRSMFAFHKEDMDLYSINYVHFGAPKAWYGVPPSAAARLQSLATGYFAEAHKSCAEFTRHKTSVISPARLDAASIPYTRALQLPGEFVLTYPKSFHQGFNLGFNCAEAVNFATEHWLPIGRAARLCKCRPDYVYINIDDCLRRLQRRTGRDFGAPREDSECSSDESEVKGKRTKEEAKSFVKLGAEVTVAYRGILYEATIVAVEREAVRIRYKNSSSREDEWLPWGSSRLYPEGTVLESESELEKEENMPPKRMKTEDEAAVAESTVVPGLPAPALPAVPAPSLPRAVRKLAPPPRKKHTRRVIVTWDDGEEYVAKVVKEEAERIFVAYEGWPREWDEWYEKNNPAVKPYKPSQTGDYSKQYLSLRRGPEACAGAGKAHVDEEDVKHEAHGGASAEPALPAAADVKNDAGVAVIAPLVPHSPATPPLSDAVDASAASLVLELSPSTT